MPPGPFPRPRAGRTSEQSGDHHRRLSGHRRRSGRRVPPAGLGGRGHIPHHQALGVAALLTVDGNISDPTTADRIIGGALERFGRIDTLINNAGIFISKPFTDYTDDDYATMVGVNLTGFFRLTQRAIAEMLKTGGGHIVNITTTLADYADSSTPSVLTSLTKGGLASPPRSLAIEYASRGIRVNAVSPGIIQTPVHPAGQLCRARLSAPPSRACGPGQRHRRRHPFSRVITVHYRRDPAHRRRPDRRPLTSLRRPAFRCRHRPGPRPAVRPGRARRRRFPPAAAGRGCPNGRSCIPGRSAPRRRSRRSAGGRCRRPR